MEVFGSRRRGNFEVEGVVESPTDKPGGDLIDPNLSFFVRSQRASGSNSLVITEICGP